MLERVRLVLPIALICDNPSHASSSLCAPSRTRAIPAGDAPARRTRTAVIRVATASGVSRESRFSLLFAVPTVSAAQTEFHYQYGKLANPSRGRANFMDILAVQQASSWSPGDSFVLIDILEDGVADGFNDLEFLRRVVSDAELRQAGRPNRGRRSGAGRCPDRRTQLRRRCERPQVVAGCAAFLGRARVHLPQHGLHRREQRSRAGRDAQDDRQLHVRRQLGRGFDLESQSFWFTAAAYYGRHAGRSRTTCQRW